MVKRQVGGVRVEDTRTGERYNLYLEKIQPLEDGSGPFVKIYLGGKGRLLRENPWLHGQSHVVLNHLEAAVSWGNLLPTPAKIAPTIGIRPEHAHRAYGELLRAGFILKRDGHYYLSPSVGWRGTPTQLKEALKLWYPETMPALAGPSIAESRGEYRYGN